MDDYLRVAVISNTHGIRGEVKAFPTTDDVKRFDYLKEVILDTGTKLIPLKIEGVKYFKNLVILKFKGIDNINDIEMHKGKDLLVTRDNAIKLEPGEYFITDLIDSTVVDEDENVIGTLTEVLTSAANDVYVVKTSDHKEILIPVIKECVLDIDIEKKIIKVHLLEGLI